FSKVGPATEFVLPDIKPRRGVGAILFTTDARRLVASCADGTVRVCDIPGGAVRSLITHNARDASDPNAVAARVGVAPATWLFVDGQDPQVWSLDQPVTVGALRTPVWRFSERVHGAIGDSVERVDEVRLSPRKTWLTALCEDTQGFLLIRWKVGDWKSGDC